jgi:hypothetical protein
VLTDRGVERLGRVDLVDYGAEHLQGSEWPLAVGEHVRGAG